MSGRSGSVLVALVLTTLVLAAARQAAFNLVPTAAAEPAEIPVTSRGQALLGYEEEVLVAPFRGRVERLVDEGERVARGTPLARIVDAAAPAAGWREERESLSRRLSELQGERLPEAAERAGRRAADLAERLAGLRRATASLPGSPAGEPAPDAAAAASELASAHRTWRESRRELAALEAEAADLEARLGELRRLVESGTPELRAPRSGTVTFAVDGLERLLAGERFIETAAGLLGGGEVPAEAAAAAVGSGPAARGREDLVAAGRPVARVVDSWTARIALTVPAAAASRGWVEVGDVLEWTIGGQPVAARVTALIPTAGGEAVAVGEVVSGLPVLLPRRTAPYELTWGTLAGQVVPAGAVVEAGGGAWLAAVEGIGLRWLPVERLWSDGERVLVTGAAPGTRVLRLGRLGFWLTWARPG